MTALVPRPGGPYDGPVSVSIEVVTPDLAREWLTYNTRNRHPKPSAVVRYGGDMGADLWDLNGESIKFSFPDPEPILLDGQNRLLACVESGTSFVTVVVRGLSPDAQETTDVGIRRGLADALKIRGYDNVVDLAAAITGLWQFDTRPDHAVARGGGVHYPTMHRAFEVLDANPGLVVSVGLGNRVRKAIGLRSSVGATFHYVASRIDPEDADGFFERLASGANLDANDPILLLRNLVLKDRDARQKMTAWYTWAVVVKAWNAWRAGESMRLLVFRPGGDKPEKFPVPA